MLDYPDCIDWPSYSRELGRRLYIVRNLRGLKQDRLSALSGVSRNQISNIERSGWPNRKGEIVLVNPKLGTIYALARALAVPPAILMPQSADYIGYAAIPGSGEKLQTSLEWPTTIEDLSLTDSEHREARGVDSDNLDTLGFDTYFERPDGVDTEQWAVLTYRADSTSMSPGRRRAILEGHLEYSEAEDVMRQFLEEAEKKLDKTRRELRKRHRG